MSMTTAIRIPDVTTELPPEEDSEEMNGQPSLHGSPQSSSYGSTGTSVPIQEERKDSEYIHVYSSTTKKQVLMEGKHNQKKSFLEKYTCTCSTCGTYYKTVLALSVVLTILSCIGFIVSEVIPKSYSGKTFIYEDSIILIERVDPTFYSDIKVKKLKDWQDHLLYVYFLPCSNAIVENHDISLNATFTTDTNIMLLPQDAMFLIEDSQLQLEYTILNSATTSGENFFVVSSDVHTLIAFKHNSVIKDTKSFKYFNVSLTSDGASTISFDFDKTGYYYIGFGPSGNTTLHINYKLQGYNYVRPSIKSSCTLHERSDTCSIKVPERLTDSYGNDYCLLVEVVPNPYITDQVLVNVQYEVEHNGKWNLITIMFLTIFVSLCIFNLAVIAYWCACYRVMQRNRKHYFSIQ